jgi:hypothetical protein
VNVTKFILIAISLLVCASNQSHAATKTAQATKRTEISQSTEAKEFIKALISIEARISSGMNFQDYSREVADLNVYSRALVEALEQRRLENQANAVKSVYERYQLAKELWGACASSRDCPNNLVYIVNDLGKNAGQLALKVIALYPNMKAHVDEGGALANLSGSKDNFTVAHVTTLLNAIWLDAEALGKKLRVELR